ncbi:MAG: shikimate kinase, partial [Flavobacteriales bacterium]
MAESRAHTPLTSISLIGFMASGKTTIGRLLAERMGWRFVDLDEEIERETGRSISLLFQEGEWFFREIEANQLRRVLDSYPTETVIAVGGGTPCFGNQMELLLRCTRCVFLEVEFGVVRNRIQHNMDIRPLSNTYLRSLWQSRNET